MRFAVAEGLRDTDIHAAAVAEGRYCLIEKPDLEIEQAAEAADFVEDLQASVVSAPLPLEAAGVKARPEK